MGFTAWSGFRRVFSGGGGGITHVHLGEHFLIPPIGAHRAEIVGEGYY